MTEQKINIAELANEFKKIRPRRISSKFDYLKTFGKKIDFIEGALYYSSPEGRERLGKEADTLLEELVEDGHTYNFIKHSAEDTETYTPVGLRKLPRKLTKHGWVSKVVVKETVEMIQGMKDASLDDVLEKEYAMEKAYGAIKETGISRIKEKYKQKLLEIQKEYCEKISSEEEIQKKIKDVKAEGHLESRSRMIKALEELEKAKKPLEEQRDKEIKEAEFANSPFFTTEEISDVAYQLAEYQLPETVKIQMDIGYNPKARLEKRVKALQKFQKKEPGKYDYEATKRILATLRSIKGFDPADDVKNPVGELIKTYDKHKKSFSLEHFDLKKLVKYINSNLRDEKWQTKLSEFRQVGFRGNFWYPKEVFKSFFDRWLFDDRLCFRGEYDLFQRLPDVSEEPQSSKYIPTHIGEVFVEKIKTEAKSDEPETYERIKLYLYNSVSLAEKYIPKCVIHIELNTWAGGIEEINRKDYLISQDGKAVDIGYTVPLPTEQLIKLKKNQQLVKEGPGQWVVK